MKELKTKDYMTIGIFAALYFVFVGLGTFFGVVLVSTGNMILIPVFTALFAGTVYMVLIAKVQKFGAILLVGVMMACFFLFSGHFIISFIPSLLCGLLGDLIARIGHYRRKIWNLLSYIVFSYGNTGPIILMWIMREAYVQRLIEKGKDAEYISKVMVPFTTENVSVLAVGVLIMAIIGGLFGQYMLDKHFNKAGLTS